MPCGKRRYLDRLRYIPVERGPPPRHRKAAPIGSRSRSSKPVMVGRVARRIALALPSSPRRGPPSSCALSAHRAVPTLPPRTSCSCCRFTSTRWMLPSHRPTNRSFAGGAHTPIGACGVLLHPRPRRILCVDSSARSPQLSPSTQRSTRTSAPPCSLAARPQQYRAPQPLQCVRASLCAAEACESRVILCTAQLVRVHLPRMVSVA